MKKNKSKKKLIFVAIDTSNIKQVKKEKTGNKKTISQKSSKEVNDSADNNISEDEVKN